jgi:outer membrane protein assembly factor BamB
MEPRIVTCSCGKKLRIPDDYNKSVARCPTCKNIIHLSDSPEALELLETEDSEEYLRKIVGECQVCGKAITLRQREKHGYYCDEGCLQRGKHIIRPVIQGEEQMLEERARHVARNVGAGAAALLVVVIASLVTFFLVGGHAKTRWQQPFDFGVHDIKVSHRFVCFLDIDDTLHALDARSGKLLWERKVEEERMGPGSFLPAGNTCLLAAGNTLQALDWRKGKVLWDKQLVETTPGASEDRDEEREERTPTTRYQFGEHGRVIPLLSLDDHTLIVIAGGSDLGFPLTRYTGYFGSSQPSTKKLLALDLATGNTRWEFELGSTSPLGVAEIGKAVGLALPVKSDYQSFNLTVLDAATGKPVAESIRIESAISSLEHGSGFSAREGEIFIYSDKYIKSISISDRRERWSKYAGNVMAGPIYQNGRLFFIVAGDVTKIAPEKSAPPQSLSSIISPPIEEPSYTLTCFDADSGQKLWEQEVVSANLTNAEGKLVCLREKRRQPVGNNPANQEYFFTAYNPRNGKQLWERKHEGVVSTSLRTLGDTIYYGAYDLKIARSSLLMGMGTVTQEGPMNYRIMAVRMR